MLVRPAFEPVPRVALPRIMADGFAKSVLRLGELSTPIEHDTAIIVGARQVRLKLEGRSAVHLGLVELIQRDADGGEVAVKHRMRPAGGPCLRDQPQRFVMPAGLVREHAEQVQRPRMLRRLGEDAAANRFGFGEPARLVMLASQGQSLGDGEHVVRSAATRSILLLTGDLNHWNLQIARMFRVLIQRDMRRVCILTGLQGDVAAAVVVLLSVPRIR